MICCPECGSDTKVLETRATHGYSRRRRLCRKPACGQKVTTLEFVTRIDGPHRPIADMVLVRRADLESMFHLLGGIVRTAQEAITLDETPSEDESTSQSTGGQTP